MGETLVLVRNVLIEEKYIFFEDYDLNLDIREIVVATEDNSQLLIYNFNKFGILQKMYYVYGNYNDLLDTMCRCNIKIGQYSYITNHVGVKKAKINF